jgi:hypothetical protein
MEEKPEGKTSDPLVSGIYGAVVRWVVLFTVIIMMVGVFGVYLLSLWQGPPRWQSDISAVHFFAIFGAPFQTSFAIFCALFVVLLLRFSTGPIEFELWGFKFRGASGPLVMWILCFLAIIVGLYYTGVHAFQAVN